MISEEKYKYYREYINPIEWNVSVFGNNMHHLMMKDTYETFNSLGIPFLPIKAVHGCYLSRFNGGRTSVSFATKDEIKEKVKWYNDKNIGVRLTLSNSTISPKDFDDPYLRFLLDTIYEGIEYTNGVICSVDEFADFIHKNYPGMKVTASHVKPEMETIFGETDTADYYNNLFQIYDNIVVNTSRSFDDEFLDQILYPDRVEFIVNHVCCVNCKQGCLHHKLIEKRGAIKDKAMQENKDYHDLPEWIENDKKIKKILEFCVEQHKKNNDIVKRFINRDEINHLTTKGFRKFKIEGRDISTIELYISLLTYIYNDESMIRSIYFHESFHDK